jgi:hypothetical protein
MMSNHAQGFKSTQTGSTPGGWKATLTGSGNPKWTVESAGTTPRSCTNSTAVKANLERAAARARNSRSAVIKPPIIRADEDDRDERTIGSIRKDRTMRKMLLWTATSIFAAGLSASAGAGETTRQLKGAQIRAAFAGMQLTDEVHWREVYERDGTLRSYTMGRKQVGKWTVEKDTLCLYLSEPDDGCYEVSRANGRITMKPLGLGLPIDGVLQAPTDRDS